MLSLTMRYKRCRKIILLSVLLVIFTYEIHLMHIKYTTHNIGTSRNEFQSFVATKARNLPFGTKPQLVIVVQVHNREVYLKYLIDSLRNAAEIKSAFLIFSHDWYDEKINKLITTIDFCKYKQIYYPYSTQNQSNTLETEEFGGGKEYLSTTAQIKHHWWWKANAVFNSLPNYEGLVLFLEEDFYVIEDFIPTLIQMESLAREVCKNCILLSLSINHYATNIDRAKNINTDLAKKDNKLSNMGIALNSSSWRKIVNCKDSFCKYDDSNWDFSLQNVISSCLNEANTMVLKFPRVIHVGSCGVHTSSKDCDPFDTILKINETLTRVKGKLFPKTLKEGGQSHRKRIVSKRNREWTNKDKTLCNTMVNSTIKNLNYNSFNDDHILQTNTL